MSLFSDTVIAAAPEASQRKQPITVKIDNQLVAGFFTFLSNTMSAASDVQIDRTFNDDLLVTGFGQKVTPLQLAGISLRDSNAALCENATGQFGTSKGLNATTLPELYLKYHAGKRRKKDKSVPIVKVVYQGVVFEGYLVGLTQSPYTISDGKALDVIQYTLTVMGSLKEKGGAG